MDVYSFNLNVSQETLERLMSFKGAPEEQSDANVQLLLHIVRIPG